MGETTPAQTRERTWVRKMDHTTDPPTPVEEIYVENGRIMHERAIGPESCRTCGEAEAPHGLVTRERVLRFCRACWLGGVAERLFGALSNKKEEEHDK